MTNLELEVSIVRDMIRLLKLHKYDIKNASIKESIADIEIRLNQKDLSINDVNYITERVDLIAISIKDY